MANPEDKGNEGQPAAQPEEQVPIQEEPVATSMPKEPKVPNSVVHIRGY